jgi:hypothetical protein
MIHHPTKGLSLRHVIVRAVGDHMGWVTIRVTPSDQVRMGGARWLDL